MNIVLLQIQNLLGLSDIEIKPGKVTLVEGKNGAGKSAVVDAIMSLADHKGIKGEIVTQGADAGIVYVKFDDGTQVRKRFNADGKATVQVTTADGDKKASPQGWLETLFGSQIVNPVQFLKMDDKQRAKTLLSAMPISVTEDDLLDWFGLELGIDCDRHGLAVVADAEKAIYNLRGEANSEHKTLSNELSVLEQQIPDGFDPDEWEGVDTSSLTSQLQEIGRLEAEQRAKFSEAVQVSHNASKAQTSANECDSTIEKLRGNIAQFQQRIEECEQRIAEEERDKAELVSEAERLHELSAEIYGEAEAVVVPDKAEIEQKLSDYTSAQRTIQTINTREALRAKVAQAKAKADELTAKVEVARSKPAELLSSAEFPVEGLAYEDGTITVNGLSLDSLSDGEALMLGVQVAKATSGRLGLIVIDGAEDLDPDNLQALLDMGVKDPNHNYILTRVTGGALEVRNVGDETPEEPEDDAEAEVVGETAQTLF